MKCPSCTADLLMAERQGVEIDYCPQCRGVWLDRGELDKILERADEQPGRAAAPDVPRPADSDREPDVDRYDDDTPSRERQHPGQGGHKKKSSFLTDMFEGFGG